MWNSPTIWSTIEMRGGALYIRGKPRESLYEVLSRTRGFISLTTGDPIVGVIFDIILSFIPRFKELLFSDVPTDALCALLEYPPPNSLENLENLLFNFTSLTLAKRALDHLKVIHPRFPGLRNLGIKGSQSITPCLVHFPLSQLTSLLMTCRGTTVNIVHYLLQHCTSLLQAEFSIREERNDGGGDEEEDGNGDEGEEEEEEEAEEDEEEANAEVRENISDYHNAEITALTLKSLKLSMPLAFDWNSFLDPLVLPSLESLVTMAEPRVGHSPTFSPAMASLLTRSKYPLNSFEIGYGDSKEVHPDIVQLLQRMPNLTRFSSSYIASPSFMDIVHDALRLSLKAVSWTVNPEGLCTFLDLLEDQITQPISSRKIPSRIKIFCRRGSGFGSARARYIDNYARYEEAGFSMSVGSGMCDDFCWDPTYSFLSDFYEDDSDVDINDDFEV